MKKSIFLFLAIIIFSTSSFSQRKSKSKKSEESKTYVSALLNIDPEEIVIQQQSLSSTTGQPFSIVTETLPRNIAAIGISFLKVNKNNFYQEISITKLAILENEAQTVNLDQDGRTTLTRGASNSVWDIEARYEYGKYLLPDKSKINVGLSIAASPSFLSSSLDPKVSNIFPIRTFITNLNLTLVPTLSFDAAENFTLALKIIPNIFNIEWNRARVDNPALTEMQRVTNDFASSFFDSGITTNIIARYRIGSQVSSEGKGKKKRRRR